MKKSRFTDSQIIAVLKQAEAGAPVPELCRTPARPQKQPEVDGEAEADSKARAKKAAKAPAKKK